MDHLSLLTKIVNDHPSILYGEAIKQARHNGWLLDYDVNNTELLNRPAWLVLHQLRISLIQDDRNSIPEDSSVFDQFVPTGSYKVLRSIVDSSKLDNLIELSESYHQDSRQPPLSLDSNFSKETDFNIDLIDGILRQLLSSSEINLLGHRSFVVLSHRCFLRRTFAGEFNPLKHGNMNNQTWHQDSNRLFGSRPMLTLWIPLQNGSAITRPGLQISGLKPSVFNHRYGDSCSESDLKSTYCVNNIQSVAPNDIHAGDCLVFNGLTFHQTYLSNSMNLFRDVLLVRFCAKRDSDSFPGGEPSERFILTI